MTTHNTPTGTTGGASVTADTRGEYHAPAATEPKSYHICEVCGGSTSYKQLGKGRCRCVLGADEFMHRATVNLIELQSERQAVAEPGQAETTAGLCEVLRAAAEGWEWRADTPTALLELADLAAPFDVRLRVAENRVVELEADTLRWHRLIDCEQKKTEDARAGWLTDQARAETAEAELAEQTARAESAESRVAELEDKLQDAIPTGRLPD